MEVKMILTKEEISFIAKESGVFDDRNHLGLTFSMSGDPDGTERDRLKEKGMLTHSGYDCSLMECLQTVAKPDQVSRLMIDLGFLSVQKYTYKKEGFLVLVEVGPEGIQFSRPESIRDSILSLSVFLGISPVSYTSFSLTLTEEEGILLAAVFDLYRRSELTAYLGSGKELAPLSASEIENEMAQATKVGFLPILREAYGFEAIAPSSIKTAVEGLVNKELLTENHGFQLNDMLAMFARSFLIPSCFVTFDTFRMVGDENIAYVGNVCAIAGLHNRALFSYDGNSLRMSTMSAARLLKTIETFMLCPDLVETSENPSVRKAPPGLDAENFCPQCNRTVQPAAKFCGQCGARL